MQIRNPQSETRNGMFRAGLNRWVLRRRPSRLWGDLLAVSLIAAGCAPRMKTLTDKRYSPRPPSYQIALYQGSLDAPHEKIAYIDSRGTEELTTETRKMLVEDLRARARRLGADAVINVALLIRPERGWVPDPQTPFRSWRQGWRDIHFLRGQAIRFKPLLIETGETSPTAQRYDFPQGERSAAKGDAISDRESAPANDPSKRGVPPTQHTQPAKPKTPSVEVGD